MEKSKSKESIMLIILMLMVLFGMSSVTAQDTDNILNDTSVCISEPVTVDQTNDVVSTSESTDNVVESNDSYLVNAETRDVVGVSQEELGVTTGDVEFVGVSNENNILSTTRTFSTTTNAGTAFETLLNSCNDGDTIQISSGTYSWNKQVTINKNITIIGLGSVILDANGKNGIFYIISLTVHITNIQFYKGSLREGGAIYNRANLFIENCIFDNNRGSAGGGAIHTEGNSIFLNNSRFINNIANDASSIWSGSILTIYNCEFKNNNCTSSTIYAGTILLQYGNYIIISNSAFSNNNANSGVDCTNIQIMNGKVTIINSTLNGFLTNPCFDDYNISLSGLNINSRNNMVVNIVAPIIYTRGTYSGCNFGYSGGNYGNYAPYYTNIVLKNTQTNQTITVSSDYKYTASFTNLENGIYTVCLSDEVNSHNFDDDGTFTVGNIFYINNTGTGVGTSSDPTNWTYVYKWVPTGSTIYFTDDTYNLNLNSINRTLNLVGNSLTAYNYKITGTNPFTVSGGIVKFQNLTFTGSINALTVNSGSVELDNCLFIDNTATTGYRNLYTYDTSKITLKDCVFDVNESTLNKADIFANQTEHINGTVNHGTNLGNLIPYKSIFTLLLDDEELEPVTFDGTSYSYDINNLNVKDDYKIVLQSVAGLRVLQSTLYSVFKY